MQNQKTNEKIVIDCSDPKQFDCEAKECQQWCVDRHHVDSTTFELKINNFFYSPTNFPAPAEVKIADIIAELKDKDCKTDVVILDFDPLNHVSNAEVKFSVGAGFTANYSVALYRGLIDKFSTITSFHFYKAYNVDPNTLRITPTVIFQVMDNNTVLYNGDVSDSMPFI